MTQLQRDGLIRKRGNNMQDYTMINEFTVWKDDYNNFKGKYKLTDTFAEGMCMKFARFLNENYFSEDSAEEIYNNTSCLRDGNRLDIHENYDLTDDGHYQISFLWGLENGIVYAEVYDTKADKYVGYIEI